MTSRAPDDFDRRQWRAIVGLKLKMAFRPALDSKTGKVRTSPLRALVLGYGFMGLVFSGAAESFADERSYLIATFSCLLVTGLTTILPDAAEGQRRDLEYFGSKPIAPRTLALAQLSLLCVLLSMALGCLGLFPIAAISTYFGRGPGVVLALAVGLLAAAALGSLVWMLGELLLLSRFSLERVRGLQHAVLAATVMTFSSARLFLELYRRRSGMETIALKSELWRLLPSAWFVDAALPGSTALAHLERGLLLAAAAGLVLALFRSTHPERRRVLAERLLEVDAKSSTAPLSVRLLRLLRRGLLLDRWLVAPRAFGVASLVLVSARREQVSRSSGMFTVLLVGAAAADLLLLGEETPVPSALGLMLLAEGLRHASQSSSAAASWMFFSAPLGSRDILSGLRLAVLIGSFGVAVLIVGATFHVHHPPLTGALLSLGYLLEGHILVSLFAGLHPECPLSREQRTPVATYFLAWIPLMMLAALRGLAATSLSTALAYVLTLALVAWRLSRWAEGRFAARLDEGVLG